MSSRAAPAIHQPQAWSFVTDKRLHRLQAKAAERSARATLSAPHVLIRRYEYRRRLPHYQKDNRAVFVTFCKLLNAPFTDGARDIVLKHCLYDHGNKYDLHAAVVMPDHVHLLFTPLRDPEGWPYSLPQILKVLKGASARSVNRLLHREGPIWQDESFDHVLRSEESLLEKIEYVRQNPVRRGLVAQPEDYRWTWINPALC